MLNMIMHQMTMHVTSPCNITGVTEHGTVMNKSLHGQNVNASHTGVLKARAMC